VYLDNKYVTGDGSAVSQAAPQGTRYATLRSSRPLRDLADLQPGRGSLTAREGTPADGHAPSVAGELVVRPERRAGTLILWLSGTLDRTTSALLDRDLAAPAVRPMRLIVDLTGLAFIDSSGLDTLVRIQHWASVSGERLSFRDGPHVAQRPLDLSRNVQLRSRSASRRADVSDENSYFAFAMACADVDHPRPGDRPGGTLTRFPNQAAGASDATPLLRGVARAAPPRTPLTHHNQVCSTVSVVRAQ
jgi:anti-anti-sigma factor